MTIENDLLINTQKYVKINTLLNNLLINLKTMNKKIIGAIIALVMVMLLVVIFTQSNKNNSGNQQTKKSVTIGMVTFPGYAPLYLANEKNLFQDVKVNLVRIESIGDLRAAMNSGQIDMYAATYDIFQAVEGNEPPGVGFLAIDESHGGDGVVVSSDIAELKDLKGKTVAAEPGFPPYFILQYLLNKEGLNLTDVNFKDLPSADAGNAFVAKQVDVAATYEPYLSISADKRAGAKILVSSADTPGLIVDLLFASDNLVKNDQEVLKKISDGWFSAVDYWQNNPDESMQIMADAFGVDKAEMEDIKSGMSWLTLEDNQKLFDKKQANNAYTTFDLVGDILESNDSAGVRVKSSDKLSDKTIKSY